MKKRLAVILLCLLLLPLPSLGASLGAGTKRVFDDAKLMNQAQIAKIEELIAALRKQHGMDIVVLTSYAAPLDESMAFADDFYDHNGFGQGADFSGFLFLIDMNNRVPTISTTGLMIRYVTDDRLATLLDVAYDHLAEGKYGDAAYMTLVYLSMYLESGIPKDQYNMDPQGNIDAYVPPPTLTGGEMALALAIGAVLGLAFFLTVRFRYAMKGSAYKYDFRQNSRVALTLSTDDYLRTHVSKTRKAPPPSSSGGGGGSRSSTHSSSSGRTHGGGSGRKF